MSGIIHFPDPAFLKTFPHIVAPYPEEWLLGLSLRCDDLNGWPPGTTALTFTIHSHGYGALGDRRSSLVNGLRFNLAGLAGRLYVSEEAIKRTTYQDELARLLPTHNIGERFVSSASPPFRICPTCIAERQYLARQLVLPVIQTCTTHGVLLKERCQCGQTLRPFQRKGVPFTCHHCSTAWGNLSAERGDAAIVARDVRLMSFYQLFLDHGDPAWLEAAVRLMRCEFNHRGLTVMPALVGGDITMPMSLRKKEVAVARIVAGLVAFDLTPEDMVRAAATPQHEAVCVNHACPLFDQAHRGNVHFWGKRASRREAYCMECGSTFVGRRLCFSFDDACAPDGVGPSPMAIGRAQAQLQVWRERLTLVCAQIVTEKAVLSPRTAFERAGIPAQSSHLYATKVGLVQIVDRFVTEAFVVTPRGASGRWGTPKAKRAWRRSAHRDAQKRGIRLTAMQRARATVRERRPPCASDVTEEQWGAIEPLVGSPYQRRYDRREIIDGIRYVLGTGCAWKAIPDGYPDHNTLHRYYRQWYKSGLWQHIQDALGEAAIIERPLPKDAQGYRRPPPRIERRRRS